MISQAEAMDTPPEPWDFHTAADPAIDDEGWDMGYEAALPGLQALFSEEIRAHVS